MYKVVISLFIFVFFSACSSMSEQKIGEGKPVSSSDTLSSNVFSEVTTLNQLKSTEFVLTFENKLSDSLNSIYAPTFLFAWAQIKNNYKSPINVSASNSIDFKLINQSNTFQNSLDKSEYNLTIDASTDGIEASAYFKKTLPFSVKFHSLSDSILFAKCRVKSFGIEYQDDILEKNYKILYYLDDEHFAIKLIPEDKSNEIFLVKGIDFLGTFTDLYKRMDQWIEKGIQEQKNVDKQWRYSFEHADYLSIPVIKFNLGTNYKSLEGQKFTVNSSPHSIVLAYQQTAFELNENGAIVESYGHAVTDSVGALPKEKPTPKKMIFDKPYVLFIKKKNNPYPYFAMKVMNTELMMKNE